MVDSSQPFHTKELQWHSDTQGSGPGSITLKQLMKSLDTDIMASQNGGEAYEIHRTAVNAEFHPNVVGTAVDNDMIDQRQIDDIIMSSKTVTGWSCLHDRIHAARAEITASIKQADANTLKALQDIDNIRLPHQLLSNFPSIIDDQADRHPRLIVVDADKSTTYIDRSQATDTKSRGLSRLQGSFRR